MSQLITVKYIAKYLSPKCNTAPYLRSRIVKNKLARELLYKVFAVEKEPSPEQHLQIEELIEENLKFAHQVINEEEDPDDKYKKAMEKVQMEKKKREIEIDNQNDLMRTLVLSLKGYPWINNEIALANLTNLLNEAEKKRKTFERVQH